jgi:transposase
MRLGDSDRTLARADLIGRPKARALRRLAEAEGWLDPEQPLPEDAVLATALPQAKKRSSSISSVEPFRDKVEKWAGHDIPCRAIYQALKREHQYTGSYSSVYRFIQGVKPSQPKATMPLDFAVGEAAQIDFGSGPELVDPETGEIVKAWFFLMTLCWSRHQYAEIVFDQKVPTWLECHRHAFEWFGGVPKKLIIDNAKCAITQACRRDPVVQRAYAEYAEGYGFKIDALPPRQPQMKGRVESGINYLKKNFLPLRTFLSLTDANRQLQAWILEEAGTRRMGEGQGPPRQPRPVREMPVLRALQTDRPTAVAQGDTSDRAHLSRSRTGGGTCQAVPAGQPIHYR